MEAHPRTDAIQRGPHPFTPPSAPQCMGMRSGSPGMAARCATTFSTQSSMRTTHTRAGIPVEALVVSGFPAFALSDLSLPVFRIVREAHEPSDQVLHNCGIEAVHDVLPMSFVRYETSVPKSRQMVTERWLADVEMLRELPRRSYPPHASSSRIRRRVGSASALNPSPAIIALFPVSDCDIHPTRYLDCLV